MGDQATDVTGKCSWPWLSRVGFPVRQSQAACASRDVGLASRGQERGETPPNAPHQELLGRVSPTVASARLLVGMSEHRAGPSEALAPQVWGGRSTRLLKQALVGARAAHTAGLGTTFQESLPSGEHGPRPSTLHIIPLKNRSVDF